MLADLLDSGNGALDVAGVVQSVEHPEDIHAVLGGLLDEMVNDVVAIVAVAQQVLASQKHLQAAVGKERAERSQALPGVFVEEPDAGVEGGTTPTLDTPVPSVVDVRTGTDHVFHRHSGCHQALVGVPQGKFCDTDLSLRIHVDKYVVHMVDAVSGRDDGQPAGTDSVGGAHCDRSGRSASAGTVAARHAAVCRQAVARSAGRNSDA
ncbi:MAG: hypothetical protein ACYDDU_07975 [Dermatophilaceae bacterium]